LRIIILLLQSYRTIQIEKLASLLPIPIKYQSRRHHLQRFLVLPQLTTKGYQVVVIGDREFGNINLADWLSKQQCQYVLRTKNNKYILISVYYL
jgi:hypothetical protein